MTGDNFIQSNKSATNMVFEVGHSDFPNNYISRNTCGIHTDLFERVMTGFTYFYFTQKYRCHLHVLDCRWDIFDLYDFP